MRIICSKYKLTCLLVALFIASWTARSQVSVKVSMDSTILLIGQQTLFHLNVSGPSNLKYQLPSFAGDTLIKGLEIVKKGAIDTFRINKDQIEFKTDLLVTSFDSGLYYIPPIKVVAGADTFESDYLGLKVNTYPVDTTKLQLFDIKGIQKPPFVVSDYYLTAFLFVLFYSILLFIIWFILRKKYRNKEQLQKTLEEQLPPHVVAIIELDKLRQQKIWKLGKNKAYYTALTEIVRKYISRRFQINALEMTSAEILELFKRDKTTQSVYQNLKQILQLSDLVKFAKVESTESENELSMMNSYLFVNQTKLEEIKSIEEQKEDQSKAQDTAINTEDDSTVDTLNKYMPK